MKIEKKIEEMKQDHNNENNDTGIAILGLLSGLLGIGVVGLVLYSFRDLIFGIGFH